MDELQNLSKKLPTTECKVYRVVRGSTTDPKSKYCGVVQGVDTPAIVLSREGTCMVDKKGAPTKDAIKDLNDILGPDSGKFIEGGRAFHFHVSGATMKNFTEVVIPKK